jgi:hypothetical protein
MKEYSRLTDGPDRRGFIIGGLGALLWTGSTTAAAGVPVRLQLDDPAEALTALVRLQARLDGRDTPWWYFGRIFGVMPEQAPRLLVRFEGLEIPRFTRIGASEYAVTGVTTSFFQDPETREVIDRFVNPYTRETNSVVPNQIGGNKVPIAFYSPRGIRLAATSPERWQPGGLKVSWDYFAHSVYMSHEREFPPGLPQPIAEASCTQALLADLQDPRREFVPASFSSTYMAVWPRWMNMQGQPGHVVWHADGVKLESADALPAAFLARMRAQFPERLAAPVPGAGA